MKKNLLLAVAFALAGTSALAQESSTPKDPTQQSNPAAQTKPDDKSTTPAQESTGAQSANTESNSKTTDSSSKAKASDRELDQQLHEKFAADPSFADVRVNVKKGIVTLAGHVDSQDSVAKAKELAQSVDGVKEVRNRLKVVSSSAATTPETHSDKTAEYKNTTPDIDKKVPGEQGVNPDSSGSIAKTTNDTDTATSTGGNTSTMPTTNAAGTTEPSNAGSIAGNTAAKSGTQSGSLPASDQSASSGDTATLQNTIQEKLKSEPMLSSSNVNVNVSDSTIELSGSVATGKEKTTAERIAQSYAGNRKVVDRITVSGNGASSGRGASANASGGSSTNGEATPTQSEKSSVPSSANPSSTNGNPPTNQTPPAPEQSTTPKQ